MPEKHRCRICQGDRPNDGVVCLGCGTALLKCRETKVRKYRPECPGCTHTGPHQLLEAGRFRCLKCTAVFEGADLGYVDERPDINAEKMERLEAMRKKRGGYKR